MADSPNKRKSPVLLLFMSFLVIIGIMFIANYKSTLVQELDAPDDGIEKLYTVGDWLIAVSNGSEVYLWNWKMLENKAKITSVATKNTIALSAGKLIWAPPDNPGTIIISTFEDSSELKRLPVGVGWQCRYFSINRTGQNIVCLEEKIETHKNSDSYGYFRLEMILPDSGKLLPVATIDKKNETFSIYELAISNDGALIAVAGQKNDVGWIGIVNVAEKQLLWEKVIETSADLTEVVFSLDNDVFYAGGEGSYVYAVETISGKIVRQLLVDNKYQGQSFNELRTTCLDVSPDGRIVAAGINPGNPVYFWDTTTGKRLGVMGGCRGLNNLAFAPDSSTFVVAGRNYGGSLKVRRVPAK